MVDHYPSSPSFGLLDRTDVETASSDKVWHGLALFRFLGWRDGEAGEGDAAVFASHRIPERRIVVSVKAGCMCALWRRNCNDSFKR